MDDDKTFPVKVKDAEYAFKAVPPEDIEMIGLLAVLSVSGAKYVSAVSRVLSKAAGPEQWDSITDQLTSGEITLTEMTAGILKDLLEAQKTGTGKKTAARKPRAAARGGK